MQPQNRIRSIHLAEKLTPPSTRRDAISLDLESPVDWDDTRFPSLVLAVLMVVGLIVLAAGLLGAAWFVISGLLLLGG